MLSVFTGGRSSLRLEPRGADHRTPFVVVGALYGRELGRAEAGEVEAERLELLAHVGLADQRKNLAENTDGTQQQEGQQAMPSIRNPATLIAAGNNAFQLSALTANPSIGVPGTGGRGTIQGGATEASTVDIATDPKLLFHIQSQIVVTRE